VEVRSAAGWSQEAIAEDMGIDADTLRKHFSVELRLGRLKVEGMLLDVLQQRAREGHVPSVRELQSRVLGAAPKALKPKPDGKPAEARPAIPPGKKEQRLKDAQDVPNDWGDLMSRRAQRQN
jgi:hypothetical protein